MSLSLLLSRCANSSFFVLKRNLTTFVQLNVTLPKNTVKVFAELYASGNGNEEFWVSLLLPSQLKLSVFIINDFQYFNTANEFLGDLPGGFIGQGPFREVRLSVDGLVAGVAYPYATIFTGGINPSVWR